MNERPKHRTAPRKKQAPKQPEPRSPSQTRFQLLVKGGATPEEHDEILRVWKKELTLGRRLKLRIPSASEAAAGKLTVTAPGSGPGTIVEMPDMMRLLRERVVPRPPRSFAFHPDFRKAEQRKGKWILRTYGIDSPQVYVIQGPGFRAFTLKKTKRRGRPRGTGRPKRRNEPQRDLIKALDLEPSKWLEIDRLLRQLGLTETQRKVWVRQALVRVKPREIAHERGISPQAVSAILGRARRKLLQASSANPKLTHRLWLCLKPKPEQAERPGPTRYQPSPASGPGWTKDESSGAVYRRKPDQQDLERTHDSEKK